MVLAITSSVFVGEGTAKDPAWLEVVSAYLKEVVTVAKTLKPYPAVLRPLLRPLIAPKHPVQAVYSKADKLLAQPIRERREDPTKHKDVMAFLAKSQPQVDQHQIVLQLMVLVSAAASFRAPRMVQTMLLTRTSSFTPQPWQLYRRYTTSVSCQTLKQCFEKRSNKRCQMNKLGRWTPLKNCQCSTAF